MEISDFDDRAGDSAILRGYINTLKTEEQRDEFIKELFKRLSEIAYIYNSMFNASRSSKVCMLVINDEVDSTLQQLLWCRDWHKEPSVDELILGCETNLKARRNLLIMQELYGFFIP